MRIKNIWKTRSIIDSEITTSLSLFLVVLSENKNGDFGCGSSKSCRLTCGLSGFRPSFEAHNLRDITKWRSNPASQRILRARSAIQVIDRHITSNGKSLGLTPLLYWANGPVCCFFNNGPVCCTPKRGKLLIFQNDWEHQKRRREREINEP